MDKFFLRLYDKLSKHRPMVLISAIILFVVLGVLAMHINLEEDISNFLPDNEKTAQLAPIYKHLSMSNQIYVSLSTNDSLGEDERIATLTDAAETFSQRLDSIAGKKLIKQIICHIDASKALDLTDFIAANIPYFLEEQDYVKMDSMMQTGNFHEVFDNDRSLMLSPMGMGIEENILADPLHFSMPVLQRLKNLQITNKYAIEDEYLFSSDHRQLIMFVISANSGSETAQNSLLAKAFDATVKTMPANIKVSYFGAPIVAVANATQIKADTLKSVAIAMVIILLFLIFFFRNVRPLIYVTVSVIFGVLFALAMMMIFQGKMSSIALGTGSVIVGIAINYALHYVIHLQHNNNPRDVLHDLAEPMITGNITTVGAFISLLVISAQAMRDLGLFAAIALVGTILFVLVFLPHWAKGSNVTLLHQHIERSMDTLFDRNKWLVIGCIVLTVFFAFFCNDVKFETDFNKINFMTDSQRKAFDEIKKSTTLGDESIYQISTGRNMNEALRSYESQKNTFEQLKKQGSINSWVDAWSFLPSDSMQKVKIARWNVFMAKYKDQIKKIVNEEGTRSGFSNDAFTPFITLLDKNFTVQEPQYFKAIADNLLKESVVNTPDGVDLVTIVYARPHCSQKVKEAFDNKAGSFIFSMQSITTQLVDTLSNDFNLVLFICSCLVFFFLWYSFGRIELSGIAFLPMAISWIWILGIMALTGIKFNIVNIILSTFIFGLGDDYTIFIVEGLMYEYAYGKSMLSSYKTSVFLSALTMLVGIGSLIIAAHPAMRSLGEITIIGMFCVVLIAFIIPPLIFRWMVEHKGEARMMPITWSNLLATVYSFAVFIVGSLLMTIYGFILLKICKPTDANKMRFHKLLCGVSRFVVKYIPGVRCRVENLEKTDFNTPSIIICNHQSHLDLMYLLMLSPKIIVLTNQWVWNFFFYGRIIRFADFYPVANGIESCVDDLSALMAKGYSIAVFPEGTRSLDGSIGRFHRGAFYLAEKMHCPVQPLVFHGIGHVLPKSELLLRRGNVVVNCLDPIRPDDESFGDGYVAKSKAIRRLVMSKYSELAEKEETAEYFVSDVKGSYRYKGKEAETYVRKTLKRIGKIQTVIDNLPSGSNVVMTNCNVGAIPLITALVRKDIHVVGVDSNEEAIAMAAHCRLVPHNLRFALNIAEVSNEDSIIINCSHEI
jgi:1-acyl-sn-glycerol-3-phosphate acyltransferase